MLRSTLESAVQEALTIAEALGLPGGTDGEAKSVPKHLARHIRVASRVLNVLIALSVYGARGPRTE